jgi:surface protein
MDSSYLKKKTMVLINKNYDNQLDTFNCVYKNLRENGYEIEYKCDLNEEVYGCPLINVDNNKIIAFHKLFIVMDDLCQGVLLEDVVKDFNTVKEKIGDFKMDEDTKIELKNSIRLSRLKTVKSIRVQNMKNDIILTYLIPPYGFKVKIFGEKFVKNNMDRCYFLLQDIKTKELFEFQLGAFLRIDEIPISEEGMKVFRLILIQTDYIYDLSDMFYQCEYLLDASEINKLNTEQCMDMKSMFEGCKLLTGLSNIGDLDVSQVKNMSLMFDKCLCLQHLDLSKWKTSNVKSFKGMFEYCVLLDTVKGLSNWDVSGLKAASFMFNICRPLGDIPDSSNWNSYQLSSLSHMFQD